jgi:hypothetical protein
VRSGPAAQLPADGVLPSAAAEEQDPHDLVRVASGSGPTETIVTGTPARASTYSM